jgi:hypothetical protein
MKPEGPSFVVRKVASSIGFFVLHTFFALLGATPVSFFVIALVGALMPDSRPREIFAGDVAVYCLVFAIGYSAGFFINRSSLKFAACWVWVPSVTLLTFAVRNWIQNYDPRWHQECSSTEDVLNAFFIVNSRKCGGGEEGLNFVFFTLPAFCSVAYSLGAWVALRMNKSKRDVGGPVHLV